VLLVPVIKVDVNPAAEDVKEAIEVQANENRSFALWWTIRRARHAGQVRGLAVAPDYLTGPQIVDQAQWPRSGQEIPFVEVA
jgi:hypothetical protein